jgi:hypothetical protein
MRQRRFSFLNDLTQQQQYNLLLLIMGTTKWWGIPEYYEYRKYGPSPSAFLEIRWTSHLQNIDLMMKTWDRGNGHTSYHDPHAIWNNWLLVKCDTNTRTVKSVVDRNSSWYSAITRDNINKAAKKAEQGLVKKWLDDLNLSFKRINRELKKEEKDAAKLNKHYS